MHDERRAKLNPDLITIDYHRYTTALAARRAARTTADRIDADRAMLREYRGEIAPALHAEWIEAPRRHAAHAALDASTDLAHHLADNNDPDQAVTVLEHAIAVIDLYNETLYTQLIRLHHNQGRPDAARRTLAALTTELAKIDATPSRETLALDADTA